MALKLLLRPFPQLPTQLLVLGMRRVLPLALATALSFVSAALAVIQTATPLKQLVEDSQYVFVAKTASVDAEKMGLVVKNNLSTLNMAPISHFSLPVGIILRSDYSIFAIAPKARHFQ